MLTKEELVIENTRLKDKLALYREINHKQACIIKESLELNKPCQEYALYKPQPYKFEELKVGIWVWDKKYKVTNKIEKLYKFGKQKAIRFSYLNEITQFGRTIEYEEDRFFPVTKAMYQGDMK